MPHQLITIDRLRLSRLRYAGKPVMSCLTQAYQCKCLAPRSDIVGGYRCSYYDQKLSTRSNHRHPRRLDACLRAPKEPLSIPVMAPDGTVLGYVSEATMVCSGTPNATVLRLTVHLEGRPGGITVEVSLG